jgi:D-alanine-D-alanine ligase
VNTASPSANKLRVLILTDQGLVPDRPRSQLKGRQRELRKTEYDVMGALKRMGHDVSCVGLGSDLGVIDKALQRTGPHVTFNLVEELKALPYFDQHVVSYLELRKQKYTGCNPRGLIIARDKALTKKCSHITAFVSPDLRWCATARRPPSPSACAFQYLSSL